ncbi:MAG: sulfotransferase [Pseudomonadales bacterium]
MLILEDLLEKARIETGLDDFGGDEFLEPLTILIKSLNEEANLNDIGRFRAEMNISNGLAYRLKVEDYIKQHPDVLEQKIEKPVFIVGLPRTGTTALHHMLNQDPANHTLRIWEANKPVPPPEEATYLTDPRIEESRASLEMTEQFLPGFGVTHLLGAEEPDECYMLFNRTFMSVEYSAIFHVPSYAKWIYAHDHGANYAYHKKQLQLLQHKKKGRWILKAPFHQLGLRAILKHYPDAILVQTHRAPMAIVASGCSFSELLRKGGSDDIDRNVIGHDWMEMLRVYSTEFERARSELEPLHPGQFLDIQFKDLLQQPYAAVEQVYAAAGTALSEQGRAAMEQWQANNPKDKQGKHEYRLEDYGLSRADVEALFGDYVKRYNLNME